VKVGKFTILITSYEYRYEKIKHIRLEDNSIIDAKINYIAAENTAISATNLPYSWHFGYYVKDLRCRIYFKKI
jgi:hypothetical protein